MTVLYSNDFESTAHGGQPTNIVDVFGGVLVLDKPTFASAPVVRGNRSLAAADNGDLGYWSGNTTLGSQALRTAEKIASLSHRMGHILRNTAGGQNGYHINWEVSGANARGSITLYDGGAGASSAGAYDIPVAVGDVVHMESSAVGNVIEVRVWTNSNARPSSPTATLTNSQFSTGAVGVRKSAGSGTYAAVDDLVITDAAGGEDFFYSTPASSITGTVVMDNAVAAGSMATTNSAMTGGVDMDPLEASGSMAAAGTSALTGSLTLDDNIASGAMGSSGSATIVSSQFRSTETRLLLGAATFAHAVLLRVSDRHPAASVAAPTTGSDSRMTINSAGLASGVDYMLAVWNADGTLAGIEKVTAA